MHKSHRQEDQTQYKRKHNKFFPFFNNNHIIRRSNVVLNSDCSWTSLPEIRRILCGKGEVKTLHFILNKGAESWAISVDKTVSIIIATLNYLIAVNISSWKFTFERTYEICTCIIGCQYCDQILTALVDYICVISGCWTGAGCKVIMNVDVQVDSNCVILYYCEVGIHKTGVIGHTDPLGRECTLALGFVNYS